VVIPVTGWQSKTANNMKTTNTRVSFAIYTVVVTLLIGFTSIAKADAPVIPMEKWSPQSLVSHYAEVYAYDEKTLQAVMRCESQGNQSTVGDGGRSFGIFQIQKETWKRFTKEMGETLDINSKNDQAKVAAWAFANGHGTEWSTYVSIKKGGTYSFYSRQLKGHFTVRCSV